MQLLAFREYPAIDAETLVEFMGHERLFRGAEGSFLLHMSSKGQPVTEERIVRLSVRDAMSWLNEEPDQYGSLWEFAEIVPAAKVATESVENFQRISNSSKQLFKKSGSTA
jgi:hypothetical protein